MDIHDFRSNSPELNGANYDLTGRGLIGRGHWILWTTIIVLALLGTGIGVAIRAITCSR